MFNELNCNDGHSLVGLLNQCENSCSFISDSLYSSIHLGFLRKQILQKDFIGNSSCRLYQYNEEDF